MTGRKTSQQIPRTECNGLLVKFVFKILGWSRFRFKITKLRILTSKYSENVA